MKTARQVTEREANSAHVFPSELGWMAIGWNGDRLQQISFCHPSAAAASADLEVNGETAAVAPGDLPAWVAELVGRLQAYASGETVSFHDVALDLSHLTEFQRRIVRA